MRLQKFINSAWTRRFTHCALLLSELSLVAVGMATAIHGQTSDGSSRTTKFDDVVFAISFSPDGRTLAIARGAREPVRQFGRIELWDLETGKHRLIIKGFDGPVTSISFSPDGRNLISSSVEFRTARLQQKAQSREGDYQSELKWWDSQSGELKHKLITSDENARSLRATQSPDGKLLALSETFQQMSFLMNPRIAEMTQGDPMFVLRMRASYWSIFASRMKLVDAQTGDLKYKLDKVRPGAVSFSPDGNLLAVANGEEVKLWSPQTGKLVRKLKKLRGEANALAFAPDGRTVAVASTRFEREHDKNVIRIIGLSEVKLFEVSTGRVVQVLKDLGAVNTLVFSTDGRMLVMGGILPRHTGEAAGLKIIELVSGKTNDVKTGADYSEIVNSLEISRSGHLLAFQSGPGTVQLIDTGSGTVKQTWDADSVGDAVERPSSRFVLSVTRMLAVAFSADGNTVAAESDQGEIKLWDRRTGEVKRQLKNEQDGPSLVAASSNGESFAEVSGQKLLFWNSANTKKTVLLSGLPTASALALSPDGRMLAVGGANDVTLVSTTGEVVKKLGGHEDLVSQLAFSRNGRLLAGADDDGTIWIWSVETGRIQRTIDTGSAITALAFAQVGETLATAGSDRIISIWNVDTGLPQVRLKKHESSINALAFSHNGQFLASGSDDRSIVLWDIAAGKSRRSFKGHDQTVTSLAFSPDGQLIASGSGNASVVLWEVGTGKLDRVLR